MSESRSQGFSVSFQRDTKKILTILSAVVLVLAFRLFYFINQNAVNILYSDQWDTYLPLFRGAGDLETFFFQAGQLRLGLGGLFYKYIALFSGWNTRAESFSLGAVMILNAVLAVYLKWRIFRKLTVWDSLIVFICLGLPQLEAPISVVFPSHGIIPLFLVIVYGICLTLENVKYRLASLLTIGFLTTFTGWGLFLGFISPLVFFIFALKATDKTERIYAGLSLIISIAVIFVYFRGYQFFGGVGCFTFPHYPLTDYWLFLAKLFTNTMMLVCGRKNFLWQIFGSLVLIFMLATAVWSVRRLFYAKTFEAKYLVLFVFTAFSLLFGAMSAVGRVCMDVCQADGARYQPLLVPAWLAFIFALNFLEFDWLKVTMFVSLAVACFILPETRLKIYSQNLRAMKEKKIVWRDCYLQKSNAEICDRETDFKIFSPVESKYAQERIDFLKERKLNFFAESR